MEGLDTVMHSLRKGSEDALRQLMTQWRYLLDSLAGQLLGDQGAADEVVQEAFLAIWRNRRQYDPDRPAWPWISRIVRNLCYQHWRRRRTRQVHSGFEDASLEYAGHMHCPELTPDVQAEVAELAELAKQRISELPPTWREVLQLSLFEGNTDKEVALLLAIPEGTVKSRKHRALNRLRSQVGNT